MKNLSILVLLLLGIALSSCHSYSVGQTLQERQFEQCKSKTTKLCYKNKTAYTLMVYVDDSDTPLIFPSGVKTTREIPVGWHTIVMEMNNTQKTFKSYWAGCTVHKITYG